MAAVWVALMCALTPASAAGPGPAEGGAIPSPVIPARFRTPRDTPLPPMPMPAPASGGPTVAEPAPEFTPVLPGESGIGPTPPAPIDGAGDGKVGPPGYYDLIPPVPEGATPPGAPGDGPSPYGPAPDFGTPPGAGTLPMLGATGPTLEGLAGTGPAGAAPLTGGFGGASASSLPMFGDLSPVLGAGLRFDRRDGARQLGGGPPITGPIGPPPPPIQSEGARINTRARVFKIADNQIPRPIDRVFFTFNHFEDVNDAINRRLNSNVFNIQVQRYVIGLEKTFWDRQASLGVRLPLNVVHGDSVTTDPSEFDLTRTSTAVGDVFAYSKFILYDDPANNLLISGGLALTLPVGPSNFAGARFIQNPHSFAMQPYLAYFKSFGRLFVIGFEALDVPLNEGDATILFNDVGFGYLAYQNDDPNALVRLVAPMFEVHVNIPLSHRGDPFDIFDEAATPDVVNLTYGLNVLLGRRAILSGGLVTPVTGPRPFDYEVLALLNIFF